MGYLLRRRRAFRSSPMEGNNRRPAQGEPFAAAAAARDWRSQVQHDARQRVVNKIMDNIKRHLPIYTLEGLNKLQKIVERFEERIYRTAYSMPDYLRKIALKMLLLERVTQHTPSVNPSIISNQNSTEPVVWFRIGAPKNHRNGA